MIIYKKGNILDASEDMICQQVNHQGVMGSGLALQIRKKYPKIFDEYKSFCERVSWSEIESKEAVLFYYADDDKIISNIFGQRYYGSDGAIYTNYRALHRGFITVYMEARKHELSVAIPYKMGCGLGGGDWGTVSRIINDIFWIKDIFVYKWDGKE